MNIRHNMWLVREAKYRQYLEYSKVARKLFEQVTDKSIVSDYIEEVARMLERGQTPQQVMARVRQLAAKWLDIEERYENKKRADAEREEKQRQELLAKARENAQKPTLIGRIFDATCDVLSGRVRWKDRYGTYHYSEYKTVYKDEDGNYVDRNGKPVDV